MKYISDFSPAELEWLTGSFSNARRHLDNDRFTSYYFSASYHADNNIMFSYSVSDDEENYYGVTPDPGKPGTGRIFNSEQTEIAFLNDHDMGNAKDVFGETLLGVHILSTSGKLDGIVTFEIDSPESFFLEPNKGHAVLSLHALGFLYRRSR